MDHQAFLVWLNEIDDLSSKQRVETGRLVAGVSSLESVIDLLDANIREARICPHCASGGAIRGHASGLMRFFCKGCCRIFNALTGTPLARLRHKDRWAGFAASLRDGETVKASAGRCMVADTTAFRWRHRFLDVTGRCGQAVRNRRSRRDVLLHSRKGIRNLSRKARKRGGKASKRGLSEEQVLVLVAVDRSGTTISAVLPAVTSGHLKTVLQPRPDASPFLMTAPGIRPAPQKWASAIKVSTRPPENVVCGELHIQTVNSRHEWLKTFLRRHRGIATKYLDNSFGGSTLPSSRATKRLVRYSPPQASCLKHATHNQC